MKNELDTTCNNKTSPQTDLVTMWWSDCGQMPWNVFQLEKVIGLRGFVIIHVFIASFSTAQGERNQMVNTKFTRPVNEMPIAYV